MISVVCTIQQHLRIQWKSLIKKSQLCSMKNNNTLKYLANSEKAIYCDIHKKKVIQFPSTSWFAHSMDKVHNQVLPTLYVSKDNHEDVFQS
jgi:hypothetical protein